MLNLRALLDMRRVIAEKIRLGNKKAADAAVPADAVASKDAAEEVEVAAHVVATPKKRAAKAPDRKAKTAAKPAVASADTVTTSVPAAAEKAAEPGAIQQILEITDAAPTVIPVPAKGPSSATKPNKQPTKRMARMPKPAPKSEASGLVSQESRASEMTDVPAVAEKPKRRGKLGLFGNEVADTSAEGEAAIAATRPVETRLKRPATKAK